MRKGQWTCANSERIIDNKTLKDLETLAFQYKEYPQKHLLMRFSLPAETGSTPDILQGIC